MQGTIYRRTRSDGSPGRWHAVIDLPPGPNGKRRQKTTTHDTKREAQSWLAKTREEIRTGEVQDDKITVAAFLTQWLQGKKGLRDSTLVNYRQPRGAGLHPRARSAQARSTCVPGTSRRSWNGC